MLPSSPSTPGVSLPISYIWCFCCLQPGSGRCGSQGGFPLLSAQAEMSPSSEDMSRPLGELQEAVEMLNDAAKERERVMEVAAETESLERLVGNGGRGLGMVVHLQLDMPANWDRACTSAVLSGTQGHWVSWGPLCARLVSLSLPWLASALLQLHGRMSPGRGG